ncbi:MAG: type II secretion system protein GspG [Labilithrix sp.]|nr:type II secretion system protein GspG [Labilithrix sp.]MCW5813560.1 type II secretion system protein GspG [Labilithrix sp.]
MKPRPSAVKVFFPWERRRGVFGVLGRARVRVVAVALVLVALIVWIRGREERSAGIRATRASITTMYRAVWAYRADHDNQCPHELNELVAQGYSHDVPLDAWGRPLRLTCPGRRDPRGFEITSDGPDGIAGGLDRVE